MNKIYDVIILGTGLKEYCLASLLCKYFKKEEKDFSDEEISIYHLDKNSFVGCDSPYMNLTKLFKCFRNNQIIPFKYGEDKDWNIDLIPKSITINSTFYKLLKKLEVFNYLEWKPIEGIYVYQYNSGGMFMKAQGIIYKTPFSVSEASSSDLMGLFEKNRCKKFFQFVQDFNEKDSNTYEGINLNSSFQDTINQFGLEKNTIDFIGHAICLYTTDEFLNKPALLTLNKMKLYFNSVGEGNSSPFIFPIWGLQGLFRNFSRICSLYDYKLETKKDLEEILYDENGKFCGIKTKGNEIKGKILISHPSYLVNSGQVKSVGKVIRRICIMNHPIPKTNNESCQIILPQNQIDRKYDIFILCLSYSHCICKKSYYVCIISTFINSNNINKELKSAMELIGETLEQFDYLKDVYEPIDKSFSNNIFIPKSFYPQSHFENDFEDILTIYEKIFGSKLDLNLEVKKVKLVKNK